MRAHTCLLLLAVGSAHQAFAQMPPPAGSSAPPPHPVVLAPHPVVIAPAPIGGAHQCDENQYYPVAALQVGFEGQTMLQYEITVDGHVAHVTVVQPSGRADVDTASAACATTWLYRPATTKDGVPVESAHRTIVKWQIRAVPPFDMIANAAKKCVLSTDAGRDELDRAELHTVVRVHLSNGRITAASILASSGIADLDQHVVACYLLLPQEVTSQFSGEKDNLIILYK